MYDIKSFYQAVSVADAVSAISRNPDATFISGGSDVLIQIRQGNLAGCSLISIHGLPELSGITLLDNSTIKIGGAVTFSTLANHPLIKTRIPILSNALDQAGGPQLRNVGTIGGNLCNGAVSADSAPSLLVLNAVIELTGPAGTRMVSIRDFYTGPGKTIREREEILTSIHITEEHYAGYGGHYIKYGKRNAMEIATLGCAVSVKLSDDKLHVVDVRLAYGVAAPTPLRCPAAEQTLMGADISESTVNAFAEQALLEVTPRTSWRASKEFRLHLVKELAKRTLCQAILHAGGITNA